MLAYPLMGKPLRRGTSLTDRPVSPVVVPPEPDHLDPGRGRRRPVPAPAALRDRPRCVPPPRRSPRFVRFLFLLMRSPSQPSAGAAVPAAGATPSPHSGLQARRRAAGRAHRPPSSPPAPLRRRTRRSAPRRTTRRCGATASGNGSTSRPRCRMRITGGDGLAVVDWG